MKNLKSFSTLVLIAALMASCSGKNDKKDLEKTRDLLKQFDVNILGIVMTRMPVQKKYYSKYGYNKYGYGYGYGSSERKKDDNRKEKTKKEDKNKKDNKKEDKKQ